MNSIQTFKTTFNVDRGEKMTKSFYPSAGIFCLNWKVKNEVQSVWCMNCLLIFKLYFKLFRKLKGVEVRYFPPEEDYSLKVLGGRV